MKKVLPLCMALTWLLLLFIPASAAQAAEINVLDLTGENAYESIFSLCWVDEELYILGAHAVYRWAPGMTEAEVFCAPKDLDMQTSAAAIRHLFTDGSTLYGLHPHSGQIFEITREGLQPTALLPQELMQSGPEGASHLREIKSTAYAVDSLFLLLSSDDYADYDKTELFRFNLKSRQLTRCLPTNAQSMTAGAEGKLILYVPDEAHGLWQYDIASDALEDQAMLLQTKAEPSGLAWYAAKEALAFYASNRISLAELSGVVQTKAYLPVSFVNPSTPAACSSGGLYAYPYSNYVFLRDLSIQGDAGQIVLTLMGAIAPSMVVAFSIENPDIAIVTTDRSLDDYLRQMVVSADGSIDLFVASAPGAFAAMRQKGFAAPLNGDAKLVEMARKLYPALQEVVFEGERLFAYPIAIQPHSWTVNETQWQAFELGNYPKTYDQVFDMIALWLDCFAEEHMEYTLSDLQQGSVDSLVSMIVKEYIFQNETSGERLSFDTPIFRALMASVCQSAGLLSEEHEQWGMPLLSSYYQGFGYSYNASDRMCMLLPPTLDEGTTQMLSADAELLFVNAASPRQEAAMRFVSFCAEHLDSTTQYMLNPGMNDPYPNPDHEIRLDTLREELADLEKRLTTADASQIPTLREEIAQKEAMIESVEEHQWLISPESIEAYRAVAQNLRIPYASVYLSEGGSGGYNAIAAVIAQYCSDGLEHPEIDSFIKALDQVTYLVYMEGQ